MHSAQQTQQNHSDIQVLPALWRLLHLLPWLMLLMTTTIIATMQALSADCLCLGDSLGDSQVGKLAVCIYHQNLQGQCMPCNEGI